MTTKHFNTYILLFLLVAFAGCDSNSSDDDPEPLTVNTVSDVAADPTTGRDPVTGAPISLGQYALISFRTGQVVLTYDAATRTDSASTAWDIGLQGTNIIVNGGTSGPGNAAAVIVEDVFERVTEAPEDTAFRVDGTADCTTSTGDPGPSFAICPGAGNGWYNYNPQNNLITPIPGRTIVVRTADGNYAKFRILSYYEGNPDVADITATTPSRYYTIEYVYQDDGSKALTTQ